MVAGLASYKDEVSANPEKMPEKVEDVQERLNHAQSDLTAATELAQQRQATQTEAEEQLQTEQDKLKKLEAQLDELVKDVITLGEQPNRVPR